MTLKSDLKKIFSGISLGLMVIGITFLSGCFSGSTNTYAFGVSAATPTMSDLDILNTLEGTLNAMTTANPDGHLHEIMREKGVTLTAREVQYDMTNHVGEEFGLAGDGELCDYYNWGYDNSIENRYFCLEVTPSGGYLERWYIYFSRNSGSELYQDLLQMNVYIILIAEIDPNLYERGQQNMATGHYAEWVTMSR